MKDWKTELESRLLEQNSNITVQIEHMNEAEKEK